MTIEIVPLKADEWEDLKRLRVTALTESPDSFSPTAESARAHDDDYWRRGARRAAEATNFEMFIVRRNGIGLGLASANRDDDNGIGYIGAMWVDPILRGQGVGARLFDTVVAHLRSLACTTIELSVTETNTAAIALYQSRSFVLTGTFEPLREGSPLKNLFMRWTNDVAARASDQRD